MARKEFVFALLVIMLFSGCTAEKTVQEEIVVPEPAEKTVGGEPDGILDCPRGQVDDPYPGQCGGYVDTNEDGICDHSQ